MGTWAWALSPYACRKRWRRSSARRRGSSYASVEAGSPAEDTGLMLGDTIVSVDGHPTIAIDDLQALLDVDHVGATLPVKIVRGGAPQEIPVVVGERS